MHSSLASVAVVSTFLSGSFAWEWDHPGATGPTPSARLGSTLTLYTPKGLTPRLLQCNGEDANGYLPGCNVLEPFNSWRFTEVLGSNDTAPRSGHSTTVTADGVYTILYGGLDVNASTGRYDPAGCEVISTGIWKPAPGGSCGGAVPTARWGHSAVIYTDLWVVFGGATMAEDGQPSVDLDDVAVLQLGAPSVPPAFQWAQPPGVTNPPPARHYHSAAVYGNDMFVYGGYSFTGGAAMGDLWQLPLTGPLAWGWVQKAIAGGGATPLYGHRAVVVGHLMLLYGGHVTLANGVHALDVSQDQPSWSSPNADGSWLRYPLLAAVEVMDADGDSDPEMVVFGGARPDLAAGEDDGRGSMNSKHNGVMGPIVPGANLVYTNGLAVLSQIGTDPVQPLAELPFILGGSAAGAFVLLGLGFFAFRRSRARRRQREYEAMNDVNNSGYGGGGNRGGYGTGASYRTYAPAVPVPIGGVSSNRNGSNAKGAPNSAGGIDDDPAEEDIVHEEETRLDF